MIASGMKHHEVRIVWHNDVNTLEMVQQNIWELWKRGQKIREFPWKVLLKKIRWLLNFRNANLSQNIPE